MLIKFCAVASPSVALGAKEEHINKLAVEEEKMPHVLKVRLVANILLVPIAIGFISLSLGQPWEGAGYLVGMVTGLVTILTVASLGEYYKVWKI